MKNRVMIYKHFDGFRIECEGSPVDILSIKHLDHFITDLEVFETAKQIQKDTGCEIEWITGRPSWATPNAEDTA